MGGVRTAGLGPVGCGGRGPVRRTVDHARRVQPRRTGRVTRPRMSRLGHHDGFPASSPRRSAGRRVSAVPARSAPPSGPRACPGSSGCRCRRPDVPRSCVWRRAGRRRRSLPRSGWRPGARPSPRCPRVSALRRVPAVRRPPGGWRHARDRSGTAVVVPGDAPAGNAGDMVTCRHNSVVKGVVRTLLRRPHGIPRSVR